jgi:AraC-like DNA-binding protein
MTTRDQQDEIQWERTGVVIAWAMRVRCEPTWRLRRDWAERLNDFDLWLVWDGRGRMRLRDGREVELRAGTCVWARPGGVYEAEHDPQRRLGVTACHFDLLNPRGQRIAASRWPRREVFDVAPLGYVEATMQRVVALYQAGAVAVAAALLRGVLMDLTGHGGLVEAGNDNVGERGRHRTALEQLAAAIREEPGRDWTVAALAKQCHVSPDHFRDLFRHQIGSAPQTFIVDQRIRRAKQLLEESDVSVKEIAAALGYSDVFFFSRQFTQKTGQTPTGYRARTLPAGTARG